MSNEVKIDNKEYNRPKDLDSKDKKDKLWNNLNFTESINFLIGKRHNI